MLVKWLGRALANLEAEYIARDNPQAAARVVLAIKNSIALLKQHPALGRPGRIIGTRELVVPDTPYIIPYRIKEDEIQIFRVFHGSRKWPEKL